jgi:uncharacterized membrane protein YdbT with pleckstrin-like domain
VADWSGPFLGLLRVPERPHLPAGDPGSARVFRASPRFWRLQLLRWGLRQLATLFGFLVFAGVVLATPDSVQFERRGRPRAVPTGAIVDYMSAIEGFALAVFLVQLPISLAVTRLDYRLRWYVVTDRAARLREGILVLTEMTFTLVNVQDIRIRQGPLQRLLGIADVELRTAGGSEGAGGAGGQGHGGGRNLHLARFRGVDNAEEIRDLVLERMRRVRDAGLGDPDDALSAVPAARTTADVDLESALRELRKESAALRHAAGA